MKQMKKEKRYSLALLDHNDELYKYMVKIGINDPLKTTFFQVKLTLLNVIKDYKEDKISLQDFLELIAPFWNTEPDSESEEIRNLVISAEELEFAAPEDQDFYAKHKEIGAKEFFNYLEKNKNLINDK